MICNQRLYLTKDRKKLVPHGDARAAFLYATPGDEIPASAAEMFGLVDGELPSKPAAKPKPAASDKEKPASETKGG